MGNLRELSFSVLSLFLALLANGQSPSFTTYMNPIIPGDHPDPTLTRIGKDFYTSGSSFSPTPVIYHSTDLVHWEAIAKPVSAAWSIYGNGTTDGVWGGHMVFYGNKYWDFFGHWGTMYFVTANKPEGPWSAPTAMVCPSPVPGLGMDNSIFIDDDGSWYLLVKNSQVNNWILQLGADGQPLGKILDLRWINPAPTYPFSWAEGPVMWKYKGYYYYSFAINAAGGQKVFRSKELIADKTAWVNLGDFFNESDPKKTQSLFQGANHCSQVVMLDDSTSWVIYQSYLTANGEWEGAGRQGLLSQVLYDTAGKPTANYPINEAMAAPKLPSHGTPWMVPHSDFFDSSKLNPEWSLLGYSPSVSYSLTVRPGWIRLYPVNHQNTIIKSDAEHNYSIITRLDFNPKTINDEAGIRIMTGLQTLLAKLFCSADTSGAKVIVFSFGSTSYQTKNTLGNIIWLRLIRVNHFLTGYFSSDSINWTAVGNSINVQSMDVQQTDFNAWTGNRQGLYVKGSSADFDLYIYRDAYNSTWAECSANQYGTTRTSIGAGSYVLDNIHTNDWAMYSGIEFSSHYNPFPNLTFKAVASSVMNAGVIEVWLDSIQTGVKIGECNISATGSMNIFKAFTAEVLPVKGTHDLYLKFRGEGTGKLFRLKSFWFIDSIQTGISEVQVKTKSGYFSLFPNPAKDIFSIASDQPTVNKVDIMDSSGKLVQSEAIYQPDSKYFSIRTNLPNGIYIIKIISEKYTEYQKLMIEK